MTDIPARSLPVLYNDLMPLSKELHKGWRLRQLQTAPFVAHQHAIPVTVDEFAMVQRRMPIVFARTDVPMPLALMALNEGANTFFDVDGRPLEQGFYVPAYIRRYPYLLARVRADAPEMGLCFDPTAGAVGAFEDGARLFEDDGTPSAATQAVLGFAERYEQGALRTVAFVRELAKLELLIDGEVRIEGDGIDKPFLYRGFQMVDEKKLRTLDAETVHRMLQNGMLALIFAHLNSLGLIRDIFLRQVALGIQTAAPTTQAA